MAEGTSLRGDLHDEPGPKPPAIAAAFLVIFDVRKGYTISWQQSLDGVKLDGVVDYKSLPSGLHNVEEDLVYFVHEDYVGISAFLNKTASEAERHARMLAVGVLVPMEHGRSWRHAEGLKELVNQQAEDPDHFDRLAEYWNQHKQTDDSNETLTDSPIERQNESEEANGHHENASEANGYQKPRSLSIPTTLPADQTMSKHHPALTIPDLLSLFGPLTFQVYRAALLRKRILILSSPSVELNCHYVYAISILSSLSKSTLNILPTSAMSEVKLSPLFNVTIQDIPLLEAESQGWVACTTDDVLATKPACFDLLVILPPPTLPNSDGRKVYPRLIVSTPDLSNSTTARGSQLLKATRRDAARYLNLQAQVTQFPTSNPESAAIIDDTATNKTKNTTTNNTHNEDQSIIESTPWALVAYTSLMWWASAGEDPNDDEEVAGETDELLQTDADDPQAEAMTREVALVAYFHRLTGQIFGLLGEAVVAATSRADDTPNEPDHATENENDDFDNALDAERDGDGDDENVPLLSNNQAPHAENNNADTDDDEREEVTVEIPSETLSTLGLDPWSRSDRLFVAEMGRVWFSTESQRVKMLVGGGAWGGGVNGGLECCGIRIW